MGALRERLRRESAAGWPTLDRAFDGSPEPPCAGALRAFCAGTITIDQAADVLGAGSPTLDRARILGLLHEYRELASRLESALFEGQP